MTVYEIGVMLAGQRENERRSLVHRVSAVLRGLSHALAQKGKVVDPFEGLIDKDPLDDQGPIRSAFAAWARRRRH